MPPPCEGASTPPSAMSYSGAVTGSNTMERQQNLPWICVGENDIVTDISAGVRALRLSPVFKEKLCRPWSNSVIVRLVGKSVGYSFMCNRLKSMWKPRGSMQVIDVDMNCYLVRFGEEKDYFNALTGGPWMIFDHYLVVQQWDPSFRVSTKLPSKMVVWVRFPHLPIQLYHTQILTSLGNLIGKTIRMDFNTQSAVRGKFARIAIEIDLSEPLATRIELDGAWQRVEYENLPELCFACGKVGHQKEACPKLSPADAASVSLAIVLSQGKGPDGDSNIAPPADEYGPWLTVTRKGRRPRQEANSVKGKFQKRNVDDPPNQSPPADSQLVSILGKGAVASEAVHTENLIGNSVTHESPSGNLPKSKKGKNGSGVASPPPAVGKPDSLKSPPPKGKERNNPQAETQKTPSRPNASKKAQAEQQLPLAMGSTTAAALPIPKASSDIPSSSSAVLFPPPPTHSDQPLRSGPKPRNTKKSDAVAGRIPPAIKPKKKPGKLGKHGKKDSPPKTILQRLKERKIPANLSSADPEVDPSRGLHTDPIADPVPMEETSQPKSQGGLGLKKARELNEAYMMKLGWLILQAPEKLWVQATVPLDDMELERTVAEATTAHGGWNWTLLESCLPPSCLEQIAGMKTPVDNDTEDGMLWGPDPKGKFSISSAYEIVAANHMVSDTNLWKSVWKWQGPNRIKHFLWLVAHNRLLTNSERKKRHMTDDDCCRLFPSSVEDNLHVLRDCRAAKNFWMNFSNFSREASFFTSNLQDWLHKYIKTEELSLQFGIALWLLWKARNEDIFKSKKVTSDQLRLRVHSWIAGVRETMKASSLILSEVVGRRRETFISWIPAPDDWITVNTDGSVIQPHSQAAGGGIIRDSNGAKLAAFSANFGRCSIMRAELRAAALGLETAWSLGCRRVNLQLDSKAAVDAIVCDAISMGRHSRILQRIHELRDREWDVCFTHNFREGNRVADLLAHQGHSLAFGYHLLDDCNPDTRFALFADCIGVSLPRLTILNK
ncbi:Putative ribonuclease H protein At1g65750 [Linum perenne]